MPLVFEKTFEKLQSETMSELTSSTNITRVTPGAKARTLAQIFNRKLNKAYQDFDINFLRTFLPFAQGRFLDYIGDSVNVPRLGASRSRASTEAQLQKVYVEEGTFGDLNNGNDIFLPVGLIISTLPQNEGITYRLTEGVVLPAAGTELFVAIEATRDGLISNVGPDTLKFTTFNNYAANTGLLFNNVGIINTGREVESDTNYRFRISNQALSAEAANQTAVRLALLVIPGVADLVAVPYARGIGTFDYIIQTVVPNTPQPVIEACQQAIARVQGFGISGRAVRPRLTGMSFTISITWRNDATATDRETIKKAIPTAIQNYVNNLKIGEEFIYNELIQVVMDVDNKIKNIGTAAQAIDQIFIYRESKLRDNSLKEELIGDYAPSSDERLIIEESLDSPIILVDKN
jgi:uncharacterized phage protein gp47/JayE